MARRRKYQASGMDMGTPEMARQFKIVPRLTDPSTMAGRVLDGTEIDKLLLSDAIDTFQHATLQTFAKRLHGFGFVGLKSPDYSSPISADATAVSDKKADTIRGAVHLFEKMDRHPDIGAYRRKRLINLVLQDAPWGDQKDELHAAIRALDFVFTAKSS